MVIKIKLIIKINAPELLDGCGYNRVFIWNEKEDELSFGSFNKILLQSMLCYIRIGHFPLTSPVWNLEWPSNSWADKLVFRTTKKGDAICKKVAFGDKY